VTFCKLSLGLRFSIFARDDGALVGAAMPTLQFALVL
jgi:hypothetical protein